jgi:signal transduction histidine kinase
VASVALLDRPSRSLTVKAVRMPRELPSPVPVGTRVRLYGAPWQEVVFERHEPVRLEQDAADAPMSEELDLLLVPGLRSVCLIPILFGDEIIGILALGEMRSPVRAPMSADMQQRCVGVVEAFLVSSAPAWEAARLRRQVRAMSLLVKTARQLLETRSDADVLACLGTRIGDWLGVPVRGVLLRVGSRAGADVVATSYLAGEGIDHGQLLLAMARAESRREGPVTVTRVADDPLDPLHGARLGGETWTRVSLPLLHGDRLLGVVCLYVGEDLYPAVWELEVFRWLGEAAASSMQVMAVLEEERSEGEWLRAAAWELSTTQHRLILGDALDGIVRLVGSFLPERLVQAHRIAEDGGLDEATWRRVGEVAAREIEGLLADIRAATQVDPTMRLVDVNSLIRRSVEMARARWVPPARERGVELHVEFTPTPEPILVEAGEGLLAALVHGIENALEAVPGGGLVRVSADCENGQVVIAVVDNGPGVPDELQHQAFVPFLSTKGKLGLGLSVVRSVVVRHGGEATLSAREGGGTALTLKLPRCSERGQGMNRPSG